MKYWDEIEKFKARCGIIVCERRARTRNGSSKNYSRRGFLIDAEPIFKPTKKALECRVPMAYLIKKGFITIILVMDVGHEANVVGVGINSRPDAGGIEPRSDRRHGGLIANEEIDGVLCAAITAHHYGEAVEFAQVKANKHTCWKQQPVTPFMKSLSLRITLFFSLEWNIYTLYRVLLLAVNITHSKFDY